MAKRTPRKKRPPGTRRRAAKRPRLQPPPATADVDLRTLVVLSVGGRLELGDHEWPPERICRWLEKADLRQLRGLLLATIDRWQKVRQHKNARLLIPLAHNAGIVLAAAAHTC